VIIVFKVGASGAGVVGIPTDFYIVPSLHTGRYALRRRRSRNVLSVVGTQILWFIQIVLEFM
jgi:hypothetical protein